MHTCPYCHQPMSEEKVRVVAPATLAEGYSFEAIVDGRMFIVMVPEGGVKEGQEFEVPYPVEEKLTMEESEDELDEKQEIADDLDKLMDEALKAYDEEFKDTI